MSNRTIYTRAYSESSAGQLVSGKGRNGDALSRAALLYEFRNHRDKWNREPTALVSVSDRIVDTVKRAFDKRYENRESKADIWIAFIEIPAAKHEIPRRPHAAQRLAEECGFSDSKKFYHEFIFEWAIPENYVIYRVSLKTLMDRGLHWKKYLYPYGRGSKSLSTEELRCCIARDLWPASLQYDAWEIGISLGSFARTFGARAPLNWISHQLFYDCIHTRIDCEHRVELTYTNGNSKFADSVDFVFFADELDLGIDIVLLDWWFTNLHPSSDEYYEELKVGVVR